MIFRLLLLLTIVPAVELVVLLQVHHFIASSFGVLTGLLVTFGSIFATGIAGAALARSQGLEVVQQLRTQLQQGQLPGETLADGVLILVGAAFLLTPGFITDVLGFTFLIPATRGFYRRRILAWLKDRLRVGRMQEKEVFVVDAIETQSKFEP